MPFYKDYVYVLVHVHFSSYFLFILMLIQHGHTVNMKMNIDMNKDMNINMELDLNTDTGMDRGMFQTW
jgi:hypothetical protein